MTANEFRQRLLLAMISNPAYGVMPEDTHDFFIWLHRFQAIFGVFFTEADSRVRWDIDNNEYESLD